MLNPGRKVLGELDKSLTLCRVHTTFSHRSGPWSQTPWPKGFLRSCKAQAVADTSWGEQEVPRTNHSLMLALSPCVGVGCPEGAVAPSVLSSRLPCCGLPGPNKPEDD